MYKVEVIRDDNYVHETRTFESIKEACAWSLSVGYRGDYFFESPEALMIAMSNCFYGFEKFVTWAIIYDESGNIIDEKKHVASVKKNLTE